MTNFLSFWFFLLTVVLKLKNYYFNKRLYIRIIVSLAILGFFSACLGRRHILVQLINVVFGILTFLFFFSLNFLLVVISHSNYREESSIEGLERSII